MTIDEERSGAVGSQQWTVGIVSLASFMVGLDVLVLMTALPTLRVELDADTAGLGWTINAYEIGYAALILTGAALGDRFGRRLLFVLGVGLFTAGSAVAALSNSIEWLIAARAVQGLGGGVATALALALISAATPPEKRGAAFGIWGAVTGTAIAVGPLVGGAIVHALTWQWIFWINVPIGIALIAVTLTKISESKGGPVLVDFVGLALSAAGVVVLAQALLRGGDVGWGEPSIVGGIVGGLVLLAAFVVWEHRTPAPMMPLSMFRERSFTGGCFSGFALGAALYGQVFLFAQYLQFALGHDALGVGLRLLPWVSLAPLVAPVAGQLTDRIGERPLVIASLLLFALPFLVVGPLVADDRGYPALVIPLVISGVGIATAYVATISAVMRTVDPDRLGMASGVANTIRQVGAVFGVAIGIAVFSSYGDFSSPASFVDGYTPAVLVLVVITLLGIVPAAAIRKPSDSGTAPAPDHGTSSRPVSSH